MKITGIFEDPISGLLVCGGVIFGLAATQFKPGTAFEMIGLTIQAITFLTLSLRHPNQRFSQSSVSMR